VALQQQQLAVVGGGPSSPKKEDYPPYVETAANRRAACTPYGSSRTARIFTLDSLIRAAFDSYLTWFEKPIPALIRAVGRDAPLHPLRRKRAEQLAMLRKWDLRGE